MGMARYMKPGAGTTVEALPDRAGNKANTSLEKERFLWRESFPLNDNNQDSEHSALGSAHTCVTEQAVEGASYSQLVRKAPGSEELCCCTILLLRLWDQKRIMRQTKATIHMGRHPAVWKWATGVVIPKRGKDDYTQLKAYRSITV